MTTQEELRYAQEGLAQMQEPGAGYFEDEDNKQDYELEKFNRDVNWQCEAIDRLEKKLAREQKG